MPAFGVAAAPDVTQIGGRVRPTSMIQWSISGEGRSDAMAPLRVAWGFAFVVLGVERIPWHPID